MSTDPGLMTQQEQRPADSGWTELPVLPFIQNDPSVVSASVWERYETTVISTLVVAELPGRDGIGLQWHVSVRGSQGRPTPKELKRARRDFDLDGWEEDNHHPGYARHYWLVVDPGGRVACECKEDEVVVTEPDGYQWSTPRGGPCRGCVVERVIGKRCSLHGNASGGADNRPHASTE